jgi:hypothetical protein
MGGAVMARRCAKQAGSAAFLGHRTEARRYFKFYENSPQIRSEYRQNLEPGFQASLLA